MYFTNNCLSATSQLHYDFGFPQSMIFRAGFLVLARHTKTLRSRTLVLVRKTGCANVMWSKSWNIREDTP